MKIAETTTPWKGQRSHGTVEIYVRNDIYENVLHSPGHRHRLAGRRQAAVNGTSTHHTR